MTKPTDKIKVWERRKTKQQTTDTLINSFKADLKTIQIMAQIEGEKNRQVLKFFDDPVVEYYSSYSFAIMKTTIVETIWGYYKRIYEDITLSRFKRLLRYSIKRLFWERQWKK